MLLADYSRHLARGERTLASGTLVVEGARRARGACWKTEYRMTSGLVTHTRLAGGAALILAFGFVACNDDGDSLGSSQAGKGAAEAGGDSGFLDTGGTSASEGGAIDQAGTSSGGHAGAQPVAAGAGGANLAGEGGTAVGGASGAAPDLREPFAGMSPLPGVPADPTNAYADSAAAAALGQRLFFDEKFSGKLKIASDLGAVDDAAKVSCKSCHEGAALDDDRSDPATVSIGAGLHTRNAPSLINSSFYTWTNWGGRFAAQWELPPAVLENAVIMNGNRLALAHRVFDVYKADYEAVFGALTPMPIG
jgi:hypothetical protein